MALSSSPLASYGVLGITTLRPGTCANHASSDCECCAPKPPMPPPTIMRITIGTCVAAPDMKRCFAAWLKIGSMQTPAKRSEEHTSELQSLMRISYAVFCLKKKKKKKLQQEE